MNIGLVAMVSGEILAFFMSFCTSKNNFKKFLKSCPILSLPIQSICSFFFSFFGEFFFEIFFTLIVEYNGCIIQKFFLPIVEKIGLNVVLNCKRIKIFFSFQHSRTRSDLNLALKFLLLSGHSNESFLSY